MGGGLNSNIDGLHAAVSGIAALPNEDHSGIRVIYSPSAEFQKDGDTLTSPIGYLSQPGHGIVFTGASPASKLCPAALPFLYDAFDNSNETFKGDTTKHCEFGIHPVVLKLKLGAGPEFEGQLIAWVYGYQPRKEADRNKSITLADIMENCIGTTIIQSSDN